MQEALEGSRSDDSIGAEHVRFLRALHAPTASHRTLASLPTYRRDLRSFAKLKDADPAWVEPLELLRSALEDSLGDRPIACAMNHGDFTPWNLLCDRGELRAFDWEYSIEIAPALFDLVHFIVQTGIIECG